MSGTATLTETGVPIEGRRRGGFPVAVPDGLIAVALGTIAFIVRWHVPSDGLFYDDAWQAFGAWKGSFSQSISVGLTQPGFTAGLMVWTRLFGIGTAALVTPALIAGALGPPVLYAVLRHFGIARSIAVLLGAALSSAQVHIRYSYHVKTYTFDVLMMLGLGLVVWHLARRPWRTTTAVAWFVGSVVVGSFSSISLVATGAAGLILALHPCGDRKLRVRTVAAQLLALSTIFFASSRTYNAELLIKFWENRDGFIEFNPNPVSLAREMINHFWNVADVFPGAAPTLVLAVAVVGLLAAAWRGRLAIQARFFALVVVVAVGGSLIGRVPFGPPRALGRVSLWLVPVIALGLSTALEFVRRRVASRTRLRVGFDAIVCVAAVLVLVSALGTDHSYPSGARSAIKHVMAHAGPRDAIVITRPTTYSFALYGDTPVHVRSTPERQIGFLPEFSDDRLHTHDFTTTSDEFDEYVDGVDRVYVVHANVDPRGYAKYRLRLAVNLAYRGFSRASTTAVETGQVDVWRRP